MEVSVFQQIINLIDRSEKILLCTHRKPDGDAVGSTMAMHKILNLLGKKVTAACADELPDNFSFLPEVDSFSQEIPGGKDFIVTLDCDQSEVDRLKYHLEDNKIHIIITPKNGRFFEKNVSCQERSDNFDLIMTLDAADISQLGKLYEDNVDLFTSVPIINIDHHISNTQFGKLNLIDVAASSTAEILYQLLRDLEKRYNKTLLNAEIATFLLSGITTDTGSFQNANTTPKSLEVAADLMDAGANQQDIIKFLFRTKKLSTLKLWGNILTKIEVDAKHRLVWSTITQQDLRNANAQMDQSGDIIDELLVHAPEAEIVVLFKEEPDQIAVSLRSKNPQISVMDLAEFFGGGGHVQAAGIKFPGKTLPEVMTKILAKVQEIQAKRLGLSEDKDGDAEGKAVTQVLDGYTNENDSLTIKPSLEERVKTTQDTSSVPELEKFVDDKFTPQAAEDSGSFTTPEPPIPAPQDIDPVMPEPIKPEPPPTEPEQKKSAYGMQQPTKVDQDQDLHSQAKAAIQAEQTQAPLTSISPSESSATRERPEKPRTEKRFNADLPDYMKATPPPAAPEAKGETKAETSPPETPTKEDDIKVSFNNPPTETPEIPVDSEEPVVKNLNPTESKASESKADFPDPFADMSGANAPKNKKTPTKDASEPVNPEIVSPFGDQKKNDQGGEAGAQPSAPKNPEPPKDPFAMGDDGLTDIERALGGL